jgi:L-fuculose-phosphate aldolase
MGNRRDYLIKAIVDICQKLDAKGWVANHDGNVTLRFEGGLLATPTAVSKVDIVPGMILTLDMSGKKIAGVGKPFSEIKLHLAAYRAREDAAAVVHAHPPFTMARGLMGSDFEINIPEAIVSIGDTIPVLPYRLPGHPDYDQFIAEALAQGDLFMMAGNGALAVGRDVKEAYLRMELLEHLLKIDHYARSMTTGEMMTIPAPDREKLLDKRAAAGLGPKRTDAPTPAAAKPVGTTPATTETIKELIAQEIKKILQEK